MARRFCLGLAAIVVLAALPATAAPTQGPHHTLVIADCVHAQYEPKKLVLTCADGNLWLSRIHYKYWHRRSARGRAVLHENTCKPDCAGGHFVHHPAEVRLVKPKLRHGVRVFTVAKVYRHGHLDFRQPIYEP